jgi:IS5 family transposase
LARIVLHYSAAAIEPVIGHCKEEHHMDRNFLAHRGGDAINAVLAAAGYNFRRLLAWLELLLRLILNVIPCQQQPNIA